MNREPLYSIEIYKDYGVIRGSVTGDILLIIIDLCKKESFTHMTSLDDGSKGFKLIRVENN